MRDNLLGYMLGALDAAEQAEVELALERQPHLRGELESLKRRIAPLECCREQHEPPRDLAARTCLILDFAPDAAVSPAGLRSHEATGGPVAEAADLPDGAGRSSPRAPRRTPTEPLAGSAPGGWSMADLVVAAGVFLAASLLFFPAIASSRNSARIAVCQNNLRHVGLQLATYSQQHIDQRFPYIPTHGNHGFAGFFATTLQDHELLPDTTLLICPASDWAGRAHEFRVPTRDELQRAVGRRLVELQKMAAGSYGYNLGYVVAGRHLAPQNRSRAAYALMSDAPPMRDSRQTPHSTTLNHGGCGYNILYEDGHVAYLAGCSAEECPDNPLVNNAGLCEAGLSADDAVIGPSHARPLPGLRPMSF